MDSLTHIVLGAAIGEAVLGRKIGRRAMIWGAFADTIPDLDALVTPFMSTVEGLFFHRGITHSLFFCMLAPPLLGFILNKYHYPKFGTTVKEWMLLFFLGISTHIFLDLLTAYEVGLFEPFSQKRVSLHVLFVADPFYTFPLIVSFIALWIVRKGSPKRAAWNKAGLIISSVYLVFAFSNKLYMNTLFKRALEEKYIPYTRYLTQPTPLNNFLWVCYAEDATGYWIGYYSLFDSNKNIPFHHLYKNEHLLADLKNNPDTEMLKVFSHRYYIITVKDGRRYFNVLQFGQFGGWYNKDAPFAFSFEIEKDKREEFNLQKGRWESSSRETFHELIKRIKGN